VARLGSQTESERGCADTHGATIRNARVLDQHAVYPGSIAAAEVTDPDSVATDLDLRVQTRHGAIDDSHVRCFRRTEQHLTGDRDLVRSFLIAPLDDWLRTLETQRKLEALLNVGGVLRISHRTSSVSRAAWATGNLAHQRGDGKLYAVSR
jgi:hypothetical protein